MTKITTSSLKIADNLYLAVSKIPSAQDHKVVETLTNHIAVIDCSGSMSMDLPRIRAQFKKKLPKLMRDGDTISIVWFSGKGEVGTLLEAEPVNTLKDLSEVEKAIDRWLRPVGMTGFKEPFEEVSRLTERVAKKHPNPFSLFFLSDGCDNQWNRPDILKAVDKASGPLASATFVEYGYYADRNLLASMAEKAGGALIFSEDFDRYEPIFDSMMQNRPVGGKRIEVKVEGDPIGGFTYILSDNNIITFDASSGKSAVPENTTSLMYLTPKPIGTVKDGPGTGLIPDEVGLAGAYAALSLYAVRMKSDVIFALLKNLGDVKFIKQFTNCFGKQKYSEFMDAAKEAAFKPSLRLQEGYNPNLIPAEDAFTVLDLLSLLSSDKSNRVIIDHPEFKYNRISRARTEADENFSTVEQEAIATITAKMATEKNAKKLKELQIELGAIASAKKDALKFVADPAPDGYSVSSLTLNEDRPNVSILVRKTGKVDLTARLDVATADVKSKVTEKEFPTFIFRNYSIITDGLVNVEKLPVRLTADTFKNLSKADPLFKTLGTKAHADGTVELVLPLRNLPVINRKMVKEVSAKNLFNLEWDLTNARAAQKVYSSYRKELFGKTKSEGFKMVYGDVATTWLTDLGFTDYSGFAPKMVQAESTDVYTGKELVVSLKGYSSLPSLKECKERMAKGKELTGCAALMAKTVTEVDKFLKDNPANVHEAWLTGKEDAAVATVRGLLMQAAKTKFAVVVGQVWPVEFKSLDENTMTIKYDGKDVLCKVEMREVEVKI